MSLPLTFGNQVLWICQRLGSTALAHPKLGSALCSCLISFWKWMIITCQGRSSNNTPVTEVVWQKTLYRRVGQPSSCSLERRERNLKRKRWMEKKRKCEEGQSGWRWVNAPLPLPSLIAPFLSFFSNPTIGRRKWSCRQRWHLLPLICHLLGVALMEKTFLCKQKGLWDWFCVLLFPNFSSGPHCSRTDPCTVFYSNLVEVTWHVFLAFGAHCESHAACGHLL